MLKSEPRFECQVASVGAALIFNGPISKKDVYRFTNASRTWKLSSQTFNFLNLSTSLDLKYFMERLILQQMATPVPRKAAFN